MSAFFSHKGTPPSLTQWFFSCNHVRVLVPHVNRSDGKAFSPLSPGGPIATSIAKATVVPLDPWSPHHSLSRGGHPIPPRALDDLAKEMETKPQTSPPPINNIRVWSQMLLTYTHAEFATLATLQKNHTCPSCRDISRVVLLRPPQIHHYVYTEWQGTLEIRECLREHGGAAMQG